MRAASSITMLALMAAITSTTPAFAGEIPTDCSGLNFDIKVEDNPFVIDNPNAWCGMDFSLPGLSIRGGMGYLKDASLCDLIKPFVDDVWGKVSEKYGEGLNQIADVVNHEQLQSVGQGLGIDLSAVTTQDGVNLGGVGFNSNNPIGTNESGEVVVNGGVTGGVALPNIPPPSTVTPPGQQAQPYQPNNNSFQIGIDQGLLKGTQEFQGDAPGALSPY